MSDFPSAAGPLRPGEGVLGAVVDAYGWRLTELGHDPGLTAAVDQHVAAVRERFGPGRLDARDLGDYALGFLDGLADAGWREGRDADYAACRLTAICVLAREVLRAR